MEWKSTSRRISVGGAQNQMGISHTAHVITFDFPLYNLYLGKHMRILKPAKLNKGDLIGVVTPASAIVDSTRIDRGVRYLESLGYRVKLGENVGKTVGYLAGSDAERVSDLHSMFRDRRVKAVMCVRGGYGTPRILHLLDYRLIARNPKIFVGFSDVTALQLAIWRKCRLMTFHGPMLGVDFADKIEPFTEECFWRLVTSNSRFGMMTFPPGSEIKALRSGSSIGRLLGGNLALVVSIMGTSYQPDFSGGILFVEDIGEEPYRVDRMLMQLRHASILSKVRGILAGQFTECTPKDPSQPSLSVEEILVELAAVGVQPFLVDMPFGHVDRKMTLPIGLRVRVDADNRVVEYLEPAVT